MSGKQPDERPLDVAALKADDDLIEKINAGGEPTAGNQVEEFLGESLTAWRDETQR